MTLEECQAQNAKYRATIQRQEQRRVLLEAEVDALEKEVARLEAEDLQPLVDRLRTRIAALKALVAQMVVELEAED